ncbi:hypothetical protein SUGI_1149510 [Cryptomeria japonica]|uniref:uncharacterized protein At4g15545 isoform X1 n=1 Tax=Cryptomeria japonica TaxID=3369 RepID=UPI002414693F|nr:uncharacterized protein At4g15545 isoform X1 [Cryptomeria japonica]XP_057851560.1 uncharacterized protein At4g15545 isoform X1 [Cryptomeria japonica]XP_057851635.1 uncharacterized protein At4g15545 isoform X1 [Cryptomeria japonica]GLJ53844.1 hypothetical protein SUGI_1149510 [Cryptomeria japonica]
MGNGSDFELPDEILTVLPTDPYDQLDLARKITSIAISSRVSKLEAENSRLRLKVSEKDHIIRDLEGKINQLDYALQESNDRLSQSIDQQSKLANEKNTLMFTVKKLNRDVAKLEAFKKTLMQSLQEEDETPQSETTESTTATRPAKSSFSSSVREAAINGMLSNQVGSETMETSSSIAEEEHHAEYDGSRHGGQKFSFTPYLTPRRTPTGTPNTISAAGSPKISPVRSPRRHSTSGSPTKRQSEGRNSSSLPPIHHATAPNSPPHKRSIPARTPRVDGKEFFRQARNRLSLEQFSAFLANIKELNAHQQTREETLRKAHEIFGADNKDLYLAFDGLLSRHLN